jgi:transcriptional regulator with XRE-family HTH domain
MNLEEVVQKLSDRNLKEVSRRVDLSYQTIRRIALKEEQNPSYNTLKKLTDYFECENDA